MRKDQISDHVENLKKFGSGPMSEAEIRLLDDIKGFLDFAIRNGLNFKLVMGFLAHDILGLRDCDYDLESTRGFLPRVTNYGETNRIDVGEPEENEEE